MRLSRPGRVPSCVVLAMVVGYGFGGIGVAVAIAILAIPTIAWAFDDDSGTLVILAALFVLTIGVMVLLIALMAISH